MRIFRHLLPALIIILFTSCSGNKDSTDEDTLFIADIEKAKETEKKAMLSTYAKSISYIPLQTQEVPLIDNILRIKTDGEILAIVNFSNDNKNRNILLFDKNGRYLRQIGAFGRGPGEYYLPYGVEMLPLNNSIIVDDNTGWLHKYDYEGNFAEKRKIDYFSSPLIKESDSTFLLLKCSEYSRSAHHKAIRFNSSLDSLAAYIDRSDLIGKRSLLMVYDNAYKVDGKIHLWDNSSDTIFRLDNDTFTPAYYIKHTQAALSHGERYSGERLEFMNYENVIENISTSANVFIWIMHNMERYYYVFDKNNNQAFRLKEDEDLKYHGLINDIDGGVSFWPQHQLSDKTFYQVLYPPVTLSGMEQLKEQAERNNISTDTEFYRLFSKLNENDNPVIMLVELK
ncbi:MAG: 6-bladed beta-propeller [Marinilabiliaceae bacterium]|jgi:hypothetical protein|nr:6-bladed beta-propeller [Marinilabiliaceae bacterium]